MRTTKKEFKALVQEHILNSLSTDEYTEVPFQLNQVVEEFKNWYSPYEQKRTPNYQAAFIDWMNGLPSCLNIEYTYYNIHQTMKSWFESMGETYKGEQGSDKEVNLYRYLIYRELQVLCKKNGVPFIY